MKTYKGYHGTVSNYAKKIETDGFTIKPSKPEDDHKIQKNYKLSPPIQINHQSY